ncbi:MAG: murein peptide amidase A [Bacteroidetes bacterium]|nr:murein peptide amidase A [Bacteroidota bacterium]
MRISKKIIFFVFSLFLFSISLFAIKNIIIDELVLTKKTPLNNEIRCYKKGNSGKNILLIGCIHGDEKAGIMLSIQVMNKIFSKNIIKNTLLCIPTANPDGNILNTRTNSHKIDINRNFPSLNWEYLDSSKLKKDKVIFWGGKQPSSEMETNFILKVDSIYNPSAIIILHQFLNCVEYDGLGQSLAEFISKQTKQELLDYIGYPTSGSIGSYFGNDKKKEIVTIEIPDNPSDSLQQNIVNALVEVIEKGY